MSMHANGSEYLGVCRGERQLLRGRLGNNWKAADVEGNPEETRLNESGS